MDRNAADRGGAGGRTVVLHAGDYWHAAIRDGRIDFFVKLSKRLIREGIATRLVSLGGTASEVLLGQDQVNIIVGGERCKGRNLLHAAPAYVWGFWYLDPKGVNWHSSIRRAEFDADTVDPAQAEYFFNGVTGYMLRENVSRTPQPARADPPLEPAAAVIFCQDIEARPDAPQFLTTAEIIRTTAQAAEGLVYVKPHPGQSRAQERRVQAAVAGHANLRLTDASVHDLNAAARVVVTQNSAAGFEALMQKKPVITCARSDFWHATLTPRTPDDLAEAVGFAPKAMAGFEYEKYFWWFLEGHCLEPQKDEFGARVWQRLRDVA
ncbi:MAG: hypothetical protein WBN04_02120 [Paracoccaceae bacterium]